MKSLRKKIAPFLICLVLCFSGYSRKDPEFSINYVVFISIFGMGLSAGMIIKSATEHFKSQNQ
jgi:hypothetical protein